MPTSRGSRFGSFAEDYERYRKPYPKKLFSILFQEFSRPARSLRILDIGCGTGLSTEPLVRARMRVIGSDPDDRMLAFARRRAERNGLAIEYVRASAANLPFEDAQFDVITVGSAFHWFVGEKALREIARVLKPGGLLFIYWLYEDDPIQTVPRPLYLKYGVKRIQKKKIRAVDIADTLRCYGFQSVKTKSVTSRCVFSKEEWMGSAKTASDYALLDRPSRKAFLRDFKAVLDARFGARKTLNISREIQICFGKRSSCFLTKCEK